MLRLLWVEAGLLGPSGRLHRGPGGREPDPPEEADKQEGAWLGVDRITLVE